MPLALECVLRIGEGKERLEIVAYLPQEYPAFGKPKVSIKTLRGIAGVRRCLQVYVRGQKLSRQGQTEVNRQLGHFLQEEVSQKSELIKRNWNAAKVNKRDDMRYDKQVASCCQEVLTGEPCLVAVVSWLQEHGQQFVEKEEVVKVKEVEGGQTLLRYWVYR